MGQRKLFNNGFQVTYYQHTSNEELRNDCFQQREPAIKPAPSAASAQLERPGEGPNVPLPRVSTGLLHGIEWTYCTRIHDHWQNHKVDKVQVSVLFGMPDLNGQHSTDAQVLWALTPNQRAFAPVHVPSFHTRCVSSPNVRRKSYTRITVAAALKYLVNVLR